MPRRTKAVEVSQLANRRWHQRFVSHPRRIQLSRKKGWKMPPNTVKVDRSNRFFGNPFPVIDLMEGKNLKYWPVFQSGIEPAMAVDLFQIFLTYRPRLVERIKRELRGKNLACWCKIGEPCHADVLLRVANAQAQRPGSPAAEQT